MHWIWKFLITLFVAFFVLLMSFGFLFGLGFGYLNKNGYLDEFADSIESEFGDGFKKDYYDEYENNDIEDDFDIVIPNDSELVYSDDSASDSYGFYVNAQIHIYKYVITDKSESEFIQSIKSSNDWETVNPYIQMILSSLKFTVQDYGDTFTDATGKEFVGAEINDVEYYYLGLSKGLSVDSEISSIKTTEKTDYSVDSTCYYMQYNDKMNTLTIVEYAE